MFKLFTVKTFFIIKYIKKNTQIENIKFQNYVFGCVCKKFSHNIILVYHTAAVYRGVTIYDDIINRLVVCWSGKDDN